VVKAWCILLIWVCFNEGKILMAEDLTRMWGKFSLLEEERSYPKPDYGRDYS
jgi:hypothetical protein